MRAYNNDDHKRIMNEFHNIAKIICDEFNTSVVLFGKLSIQEYFNKYLGANKIEILISNSIKESELKNVLLKNGYEYCDNRYKINNIIIEFDSIEKYLDLYDIKSLDNYIKALINDPSEEIKNDPKKLTEWVKNQNGYYLFDREALLKIYKDNDEIINIINDIDVGK